jgi:hypothetical protein
MDDFAKMIAKKVRGNDDDYVHPVDLSTTILTLRAIKDAGYAVVPVEPTEDIITAMVDAVWHSGDSNVIYVNPFATPEDHAKASYHAGVFAAPRSEDD